MCDKPENFSDENFSSQNLQGQDQGAGISGGDSEKAPAMSRSVRPDQSDGMQRNYSGQCPSGVCSLNWKPLRPAA